MVKLLFLDFDGVLNDSTFRNKALGRIQKKNGMILLRDFKLEDILDPERIARLNRLTELPDVKVVITSSWRDDYSLNEIVDMLRSKGFKGVVKGKTLNLSAGSRHIEIKRYLADQYIKPDRFVILDDDPEAGVDLGRNFVRIQDGLTDEHVDRAMRVLE